MTSRHWNFPVHLSYLATWVLLGDSLAQKPVRFHILAQSGHEIGIP